MNDKPFSSDRIGGARGFDEAVRIAEPLGGFSERDRERRVFPSGSLSHVQVTYGSHAVALGVPAGDNYIARKTLSVLMHHGGGREVLDLRLANKADEVRQALVGMEESTLYFLLYAISEAGRSAYEQGRAEERARWVGALEQGRVKKRRPKAGVRRGGWDILEEWEMPRARA